MGIYENFSFLDQLKDTTIDFEDYLEEFSTTAYQITFNNNQAVLATAKNIFEKYTLIKDFQESIGGSFTTYNIQEGELPEDVSFKFYQTIDFWWAILLFNGINNPFTDWPVNEEQIVYLVETFERIENKFSSDGYYRMIFERNEDLRAIKILNRTHLDRFISVLNSIEIQEGLTINPNFTVQI